MIQSDPSEVCSIEHGLIELIIQYDGVKFYYKNIFFIRFANAQSLCKIQI